MSKRVIRSPWPFAPPAIPEDVRSRQDDPGDRLIDSTSIDQRTEALLKSLAGEDGDDEVPF